MKKSKKQLDTCIGCGSKFKSLFDLDIFCKSCIDERALIENIEIQEEINELINSKGEHFNVLD